MSALAGEQILTGPDAEGLLRSVLDATGVTLHAWRVRAVHRRGASSLSVVYEGDVTDANGRDRSLLYVGHVADRAVPDGAAVVAAGDARLHVWRFPQDPYLPGLPSAVSRTGARALLDRYGMPAGAVRIHTRSYRPTRRAVVELAVAGIEEPLLYRKVLGGRTPEQVERRTRDMVATHAHLGGSLPVPTVLASDVPRGLVTLERLPGRTLRALLRTGGAIPPVDDVLDLVRGLTSLPGFPEQAAPEAYADIDRHVRSLGALLPDELPTLERIHDAVRTVGGPRGLVHGDLHDGQLLVQRGRVTGLLDVDGVGEGLIAQDTGRFVANVQVAAEFDPAQRERVERYAAELFDAFTTLAPPRDTALGAAAAWIGLATGPFRVQAPTWRADTRRRIARAAGWVDRAGG